MTQVTISAGSPIFDGINFKRSKGGPVSPRIPLDPPSKLTRSLKSQPNKRGGQSVTVFLLYFPLFFPFSLFIFFCSFNTFLFILILTIKEIKKIKIK